MPCGCKDWQTLIKNEVVLKHPSYGWVLRWIMVTEEDGYAQINNYHISLDYCPFCGVLLDGDQQ